MEGTEKVHIVFSDFRRGVEISLTKRWSSTASPVRCERNLEPESFQQRDRGNSDVWFVVTHKRVVPKNDGTFGRETALRRSVGAPRQPYDVLHKPFVETFLSIIGQGTSRGNSNRFLHGDTDRPVMQNAVC